VVTDDTKAAAKKASKVSVVVTDDTKAAAKNVSKASVVAAAKKAPKAFVAAKEAAKVSVVVTNDTKAASKKVSKASVSAASKKVSKESMVVTDNIEAAEGTEGETINKTGGDNRYTCVLSRDAAAAAETQCLNFRYEDAAEKERKKKEVDAQKSRYRLVLINLRLLDNGVFGCFHANPPDPED
jgi:hypothetical protein